MTNCLYHTNKYFFCALKKKSAAVVHYGNSYVSNADINTKMDEKLNKFKSSRISELIENMKDLIQPGFQNSIQMYKNQLEEG